MLFLARYPKPLLFKFGAARLQVEILFVSAGNKPIGVRQRGQIQILPGDLNRKIHRDPRRRSQLEPGALELISACVARWLKVAALPSRMRISIRGVGPAGSRTSTAMRSRNRSRPCRLLPGPERRASGSKASRSGYEVRREDRSRPSSAQRDLLVSDRLAKTYRPGNSKVWVNDTDQTGPVPRYFHRRELLVSADLAITIRVRPGACGTSGPPIR